MPDAEQKQIDRPVVEIRQISFSDNIGKYEITFDNGVTLAEQYDMNTMTGTDGQPMSASDFIKLLAVENNPSLKYKLVRTMGKCMSSAIVNSDENQPQEAVAIEGFWSELGDMMLQSLNLGALMGYIDRDDTPSALVAFRQYIMEGGSHALEDSRTMLLMRRQKMTNAGYQVLTMIETFALVMGRIEVTGAAKSGLRPALEAFLPGSDSVNAHLVDMIKEYEEAKDDKKVNYLKAIEQYRKDLGKKDPCASYVIGCVYLKSGEDAYQSKAFGIINKATKNEADQTKFNSRMSKAKLSKYAYHGTVGKEEMMFDAGLPEASAEGTDSPIYKAAEKLVATYKAGEYKSREAYNADCAALVSSIEDAKDEPAIHDLVIGGYAMLFTGDDAISNAKTYLGHASKKGTGSEQAMADKILKAIEDNSICDDIPMASYMFDKYDEGLEADMKESLKLVGDGKSDDDKGQIKFGMGKEAQRKMDGDDSLVPYDYYCMAVIFEHSDQDELSNTALKKGKALAKENKDDLDVMQFDFLKTQIS